jgi:putative CRISPR-associated protein (TIGR02619 family)
MTSRLLLVSTCGTSLLTNGASPDDRAWLTKSANDVEVDAARLTQIVNARREGLKAADETTRRKMSAELNGIGAVLDRYKPKQLFHLLVHTDTEQGKATAYLVQEVLGNQTSLVSAGGLRTNDLASFRAALADLTKQLEALVQSYRAQGWFVVFNLTGGFKSLNGYLQTLAMISADRCVFLFEGAPELMEIPRLPVRLAALDELREHAALFRRLAVGYTVRTDDAKGAPDSLLIEVDDVVTTSVLGDLAWDRHRKALFAEKLQPPLSTKVRLADAVQKVFAGLEAAQKVHVNQALDEFSAYVDHVRPLLKSRTFKKLSGAPAPGSTHELYVWSDGGTGRLLGHYDSAGNFVFDRLENHLP